MSETILLIILIAVLFGSRAAKGCLALIGWFIAAFLALFIIGNLLS